MTIGERIKEIRNGISQSEFSSALNIGKRTLVYYETNERAPSPDFLIELSSKYGINIHWILTGEGGKYFSQKVDVSKMSEAQMCDVDLVYIPRVSAQLSAGNGSLVTDQEIQGQYAFRSDWISKKGQPKQMVILGVNGVSMQPEIYDNDIVMIDTSQAEVRSGKIYAVGVEGTILVKYVDIEPGQVVLRSANRIYDPIYIPIEDEKRIKIIGRVVWISREY